MNKKTVLIAILASGSMLVMTPSAYAQTPSMTPMQSLIQKIASTFGLAQKDVEKVFVDHKTSQLNAKAGMIESKLNQKVQSGKLTDAQKKLILDKYNELLAKRKLQLESWSKLTPQERVDAMKKQRDELEAWAKTNNIDLSILKGFGGPGMGMMGRGFGPMHGIKGDRDSR